MICALCCQRVSVSGFGACGAYSSKQGPSGFKVQAGKSTLGILNPLIDANAASFHDVTTGSSS